MNTLTRELNTATAELKKSDGNIHNHNDMDARDWAGFFAALASFMSTLLPMLLPLFTTDQQGQVVPTPPKNKAA
jgi:hypothetical protein